MAQEKLIKTFIPNLTGLRFFLAFLVVIFHTAQFNLNRGFPSFNQWAVFNKGSEAVYVFFTLSGFLIIRQLYIEKYNSGTIDLKGFYIRRALRILPLYYAVLCIGFFYYQLILPRLGFEVDNNYDLVEALLLGISFFPNILSTYSPGGIIEILWSIGIEEQFYLFIAPLLFLIPQRRILIFLALFTVTYFILFFSDVIPFLDDFEMLFFYFSLGGICSILFQYQKFRKIIKKCKWILIATFTSYFLSSFFIENLSRIVFHAFSALLFGLTLCAFSLTPYWFLENKWIKYLGKISYGIYMLHAIAIQITGLIYMKLLSLFEFNFWVDVMMLNLITLSITVVLAHFSYIYFESFFLKLKKRTRSSSA
ncbi:MAG: acyltransferase [Nonlabens sp.]